MKFPKTRHKIEEAEFYFGNMEEYAHKALSHGAGSKHELKVFRFYLSAFLSAGMSVRDGVLRKEMKENKKVYDAVYPTWVGGLSPEDRKVWESMKDRRDDEIHIAGVELKHDTALVPITEARGRAGWPPTASHISPVLGYPSEAGPPKVGVLAPQFVNPDGSLVDVFSECKKYLALLKGLLIACEQSGP